jgi:hypothetical protein
MGKYFYFIIAVIVWLIHLILIVSNLHFKFLDNYIDDFVLLPIILSVALILQRNFVTKNIHFVFNKKLVIFSCIYFCIVFELIIPSISPYFTKDWFDCIAYGVGALYFQKLINK